MATLRTFRLPLASLRASPISLLGFHAQRRFVQHRPSLIQSPNRPRGSNGVDGIDVLTVLGVILVATVILPLTSHVEKNNPPKDQRTEHEALETKPLQNHVLEDQVLRYLDLDTQAWEVFLNVAGLENDTCTKEKLGVRLEIGWLLVADNGNAIVPVLLSQVGLCDLPANAPCIVGFLLQFPSSAALSGELVASLVNQAVKGADRDGTLAAGDIAAAMLKCGDNHVVWEYKAGFMREVWRDHTHIENLTAP